MQFEVVEHKRGGVSSLWLWKTVPVVCTKQALLWRQDEPAFQDSLAEIQTKVQYCKVQHAITLHTVNSLCSDSYGNMSQLELCYGAAYPQVLSPA
jgi:recombinational DNA repair protein RecR